MPRKYRVRSISRLLVYVFSLTIVAVQAQDAAPSVTEQTYPDSTDGLKAQFADLIRFARTT